MREFSHGFALTPSSYQSKIYARILAWICAYAFIIPEQNLCENSRMDLRLRLHHTRAKSMQEFSHGFALTPSSYQSKIYARILAWICVYAFIIPEQNLCKNSRMDLRLRL